MGFTFDPLVYSGLVVQGVSAGSVGDVHWKAPVANAAALPASLNLTGDVRVTLDTGNLWEWNGSAWFLPAIPYSEKGAANGVATLDGVGHVPLSQLPSSVVEFKGNWSAATNTPTLANGTGVSGWFYIVTASGTVNFGAGPITFATGDWVMYDGSVWFRADNFTGYANAFLSNLASPTAINQNLLPGTDNSITLGSSSKTLSTITTHNLNGPNASGFPGGPAQIALSDNMSLTTAYGSMTFTTQKYDGAAPINITSNVGFLNAGSPTGAITIASSPTGAGDPTGNVTLQTGTTAGTRGHIILNGGSIDAVSSQIHNVVDPSSAQDAATKNYIDSNFANTTLSNLTSPTAINQDLLFDNVAAYNISIASSTGNGKTLTIKAGDTSAVHNGGLLNLFGGDAPSGKQGGPVSISGGQGFNQHGGVVTISGGASDNSHGGDIFINGGAPANTGNGGSITLNASGGGPTSGIGGSININAAGSSTDVAGDINFITSTGISGTGTIVIVTGDPSAADINSGVININSGNVSGTGNSGGLSLFTGQGIDGGSGSAVLSSGNVYGNGNSGDALLRSGVNNGTVGVSGNIVANSGGSFGSASGNVNISSGNGLGTNTSSGNITLLIGNKTGGGTKGFIQLQDGSEGTAGQIWTSTDVNGSGSWVAPGANTALSNLTSTSINQSLIPDSTLSHALGSVSNVWNGSYISSINDSTANLSADFENRRLDDSTSNTSIQWQNRTLNNPIANTILHWDAANMRFTDGSQGTAGWVWTSIDTSGSGTWVAPSTSINNKELFILSGTDITNQYIDLTHVAKTNSVYFAVKGSPSIIEGASYDYSVNYTGGAGGNTRITFLNDLATGGVSALIAGDIVVIQYQY